MPSSSSPSLAQHLDAPHAAPAGAVAAALEVDPARGLPVETARQRLAEHGPNQLEAPPGRSRLSVFAAQFKSLLILVLVTAAALAAAVGETKDAIVVAIVLLLNATLGYVQEQRAERSVDALRSMLATRARVRRDGRLVDVEGRDLVPGDVVLLEAGDRVPADGRVLHASVLAADESSLTGESVPADKHADASVAVDAPVADRATMLWTNTTVVRGRAELLVTATGMDTRIGAVAELLSAAPARPTPLQRQIDTLGKRLAAVAGVAVLAVFAIALARGDTFAEAALDAIALAIAAIPEGLPAVVTVTLAVGTATMARRHAIVKRLPSVETLGATSVICTDKTGTLTRNEMTATVLWRGGRRSQVSGEGYGLAGRVEPQPADAARAAAAMALCNDADVNDAGDLVGDPTEGALLVLAAKLGVDLQEVRARARADELPFDSTTKLMATVHPGSDGRSTDVFVKGAPDVVLRRCTTAAADDGRTVPLDEVADDWSSVIEGLAGDGLRLLAVASRSLPGTPDRQGPADTLVDDLTLEAIVGLLDPPRPGVADAVATAHRAGVRVKMITGDHPATAAAIAAQIGIRGEVATGADLDRMDDAELAARIEDIGVCARVAPEHKVRIVEALQSHDLVTAMTGDGVNDAAALKRADIGIAMGIAGTEVTKEAADLILTDDDFTTIVDAVERGRGIYDNIISFVRFQLATNFGAIASILGARLLGLPTPFTPIQILWVNLIMDGPPAMALGVDPARPDTMTRAPRPTSAQILDRSRLLPLLLNGAVMAVGTLGVFAWALGTGDDAQPYAVTMAFTTFVLFQFFNAVNARVEHTTVFSRHTLRNRSLWLALAGVLLLQVAAIHLPAFRPIVDTVPLRAVDWGLALLVATSITVVEELRKLLLRRRR